MSAQVNKLKHFDLIFMEFPQLRSQPLMRSRWLSDLLRSTHIQDTDHSGSQQRERANITLTMGDDGADFYGLEAVFCQTPVAAQNENNVSETGAARALTLLINTVNGIQTIQPEKTKNIYTHIYMISQHLNPCWLQPAQNGNYTTLLTKAAAPDRPFNKLHRGPGRF